MSQLESIRLHLHDLGKAISHVEHHSPDELPELAAAAFVEIRKTLTLLTEEIAEIQSHMAQH